MSGNAPQGSSSEAKSEITFLADEDQKPNIHSNPEFVNLKIYYQVNYFHSNTLSFLYACSVVYGVKS
jgi:hypothetical protein